MFFDEQMIGQPVFFLFIAFSFLLSAGYLWGRRQNKAIFRAAFQDLTAVIQPDDQTFTNIGGVIGYHAELLIKKKGAWLSRVDATITLLPRHALLYLPLSMLIRRYDRLFITLQVKAPPPAEGHLIEVRHEGFRGTKIENARRLGREAVTWGGRDFHLYYESETVRGQFARLMQEHPDPGVVRHIALVPQQKKVFIFMIHKRGSVERSLRPLYRWLSTLFPADGTEGRRRPS